MLMRESCPGRRSCLRCGSGTGERLLCIATGAACDVHMQLYISLQQAKACMCRCAQQVADESLCARHACSAILQCGRGGDAQHACMGNVMPLYRADAHCHARMSRRGGVRCHGDGQRRAGRPGGNHGALRGRVAVGCHHHRPGCRRHLHLCLHRIHHAPGEWLCTHPCHGGGSMCCSSLHLGSLKQLVHPGMLGGQCKPVLNETALCWHQRCVGVCLFLIGCSARPCCL